MVCRPTGPSGRRERPGRRGQARLRPGADTPSLPQAAQGQSGPGSAEADVQPPTMQNEGEKLTATIVIEFQNDTYCVNFRTTLIAWTNITAGACAAELTPCMPKLLLRRLCRLSVGGMTMIDDDFPPMAGQAGGPLRPAGHSQQQHPAEAFPDLAAAAPASGSDQEAPAQQRQRRYDTIASMHTVSFVSASCADFTSDLTRQQGWLACPKDRASLAYRAAHASSACFQLPLPTVCPLSIAAQSHATQ